MPEVDLFVLRKQLKGTSIDIREDLTKTNQELLLKVKDHQTIQSAWNHDGKIIALIAKDGREYKNT